MEKYDILKQGWIDDRGRGMATHGVREALYGIVARKKEESGSNQSYALATVEEAKEEHVRLGETELAYCTVTASRTNQIVKTVINGMAGTVKEWVSNGDVAIGLTVTLLNQGSNEYPWEEVEALKRELVKAETLKIESRWLNEVWDVTRVVVESYHMTGRTDRNYEVVEVSLASDKDYVIEEEAER